MSFYLHLEHQLGFLSVETILVDHNFEKLVLDHGAIVNEYMADNCIFKATAFVTRICDHNQKVNYCGLMYTSRIK